VYLRTKSIYDYGIGAFRTGNTLKVLLARGSRLAQLPASVRALHQ